ncbi:hypothetical protein NQD34_000829 [Periophthalmus magnuspinnatus]|nr:hypothetical protein NQD34_000829 [Periophthalmus magnuspinnatus]
MHSYCERGRLSTDDTCNLTYFWSHLLVVMEIDTFDASLRDITGKALTKPTQEKVPVILNHSKTHFWSKPVLVYLSSGSRFVVMRSGTLGFSVTRSGTVQ